MNESDEALFERMCRGEMAAFDALYKRFERPLYGFIRHQLKDPHVAEDLFHEAFMAVLRERGRADTPKSFRAWLFQVARHLCLNESRKQRRGARAVTDASNDENAAEANPEQALSRLEGDAAFRAAVDRLPPVHAELYSLRAAGLSYEEMADVLSVPVGTVKSRLHEMVSKLKQEMSRWAAS